MTESSNTATPPAEQPAESQRSLPEPDLHVDFGQRSPGVADPMPVARRNSYNARIRRSVDAQAAGAETAARLFIS